MIKSPFLKLLLLICMACTASTIYAYDVADLYVDDSLFTGSFSGMQNIFATVNFIQVGNDFGGALFWKDIQTLAIPETISLNGSTKICTQQIRGLYYNSQRGMRVRPLDTRSIGVLTGMDSSYESLQMTGGRFIGCDGDFQNIYGNISYTRSGTSFELIAGVEYNFTNNTYTPTYSGSLKFINGHATGYIYDNYGGIGTVDGTGLTTTTTYTIKAWPEYRKQGAAGTTSPNFIASSVKVGIYDTTHTLLYTGIVSLGWGGTGDLAIIGVLSGTYNITVEGISHTRSLLSGIVLASGDRILDFTTGNTIVGTSYHGYDSTYFPYTGNYQYVGDINNGGGTGKDQIVNAMDFSRIAERFNSNSIGSKYGDSLGDFNNDGSILTTDIDVMIANWINKIGRGVGNGGTNPINYSWIIF